LAVVELREVAKRYPGHRPALDGVHLAIGEGEFLVVVGPSGSGKSTLLRIIAGLETPSSGSLWINGRRADGLPPYVRDVAMVFQTPALFPYLTAEANMAFGLRARGGAKEEARARVRTVAAQLGLESLLGRRPRALSGGERQRVALGRAIVRQAGILLLDEPLSSLDAPLRAAMRADLIDLHRRSGATMVLVTHDQAEALALGDRIAVLQGGKLVQLGTPEDVYRRPASRFVAEFIGSPPMNLLPCEFEQRKDSLRISLLGSEPEASVEVSCATPWANPLARRESGQMELGLRAEHIRVVSAEEMATNPQALYLTARVTQLEPLGHETLTTLALASPRRLTIRLPHDHRIRVDDSLTVHLNLAQAMWFDPATGRLVS
jgi:multiple sugar transport system ATP-binding protein